MVQVVDFLPIIRETLGSISSKEKKKKK
jgi:hypothetical protein